MDWHKAGEEKEKENKWEGKNRGLLFSGFGGVFFLSFLLSGFF